MRKGAACHLSAAALLNSNQCWRETEAGSPAALSSCPLSAIELTQDGQLVEGYQKANCIALVA